MIQQNSASGMQYLLQLTRNVVMAAGLVSRSADMGSMRILTISRRSRMSCTAKSVGIALKNARTAVFHLENECPTDSNVLESLVGNE